MASPPATAGLISILSSDNYFVIVTASCARGDLNCSKVEYYGVNKKTGASVKLKGVSEVRYCGDGESICEWLGYVFKTGKTSYYVSRDARLSVYQGDKTLVDEEGKWIDQMGFE